MSIITLDDLRSVSTFSDLPEEPLQWMLEVGEALVKEPGELLFDKGTEISDMKVLISGRYFLNMPQGIGEREVGVVDAPGITGVLPYSRLKEAVGSGRVINRLLFLSVPKSAFPEMISKHQSLVEALVHLMTSRVREFTSMKQQNDKLMALGKLSAGLAHELNNPASAVVRSASGLKKHLHSTPEDFKKVISMRLDPAQVDAVNELLFKKAHPGKHANCSLLERSDLQDSLLDWLEDHEIPNADEIAEIFVDFGLHEENLEQVLDHVSQENLGPVLNWMTNVFTTEKMVTEIQEASQRISDLVQSIKSYSHMDRAQTRESISVHHGLNSTVTMLQHKFKKNKVELEREFADNLPEIMGFPSELNQVWTNIIDNALDALESSGGRITIKTWQDREFVRIRIIDNGPGIPESTIRKIFDPFFTTKPVGQGTGLGLDVVMKIVQHHHGDIKVKSEPGKTEFEVCLPIE